MNHAIRVVLPVQDLGPHSVLHVRQKQLYKMEHVCNWIVWPANTKQTIKVVIIATLRVPRALILDQTNATCALPDIEKCPDAV